MNLSNQELTTYLKNFFPDQYNAFINARPEKTAIRLNTLKIDAPTFRKYLDQWQVKYSSHPVNPYGMIIEEDFLPLSHTLSFFKGEFNYQGIASQIPVLALNPQPGETILDMTASPGSKSTQIAALMQNKGRLVLNEVSTRRQQALVTNTLRNGVINDVTLCMPGQRIGVLFYEFFDRVLVDAPCSALGTLSKNSYDLNKWWSAQAMEKLTKVQHHLLVSAIKALKVNGIIVYSTCSITPEENEKVIDQLIKNYPIRVEEIYFADNPIFHQGLTQYEGVNFHKDLSKTLRTFPHTSGMEGFFIAKLRKTEPVKINTTRSPMKFTPAGTPDNPEIAPVLEHLSRRWGIDYRYLQQFHYIINQKRLWMFTSDWHEIPSDAMVKAGLVLAEKRFREWKLSNASVQFLKNKITRSKLELDQNQLSALFREGELELPGHPPAYYVLTYEDEPIASVSFFNGKLKIRLPHFFKLIM